MEKQEPIELERELDREDYTFFIEPFDESEEHIKDLESDQTGEAIEILSNKNGR